MSNSFYTPTAVSKEFVRLLEQELVLGKMVGVDMSSDFQKNGDTVYVRRQMQYLGQDDDIDLTGFSEDVNEGTVSVAMDKTWSNKVTIGAKDRTLNFDRWSEMVVKPMARRAAEKIENSLASLYTKFYHFDGTAGTVPSTILELAEAGAYMTDVGIPVAGRLGFHPPTVGAKLSNAIATSNIQGRNKTALEKAMIGTAGGFDNYETAFTPTHTVGVATGTPLVNGGSQATTYDAAKNTWSQTLKTDGWTNSTTGILKAGDTFTITGVNSIHPGTKADTGRLQSFTVLADADSGASTGPASLTVSPPIITSGAFQTVTAQPANNAAITVTSGTGGQAYRQSLLLDPQAVSLVSRPLDIPGDAGLKTSTQSGNHVTVSVSEWTDGNTLGHNMRFDLLWGREVLDPRRGARLTS
ncbi:MAG: P22 phage major capsid protein family protein [Pelagimonas sp.]|uniref:P22 phage major capsid protein family protein n=1 Tax=Pelagimonas sp. TaxID=2073170 RepID=UPI003D6A3A1D